MTQGPGLGLGNVDPSDRTESKERGERETIDAIGLDGCIRDQSGAKRIREGGLHPFPLQGLVERLPDRARLPERMFGTGQRAEEVVQLSRRGRELGFPQRLPVLIERGGYDRLSVDVQADVRVRFPRAPRRGRGEAPLVRLGTDRAGSCMSKSHTQSDAPSAGNAFRWALPHLTQEGVSSSQDVGRTTPKKSACEP